MSSFEVRVNEEQLAEAKALFELAGGNSDECIRIAINKSGPRVRTRASAEIRKQVRLKAGYVNDRLKFERASRAKLSGRIVTPSRGLLMTLFDTNTQVANETISWLRPPPVPTRGIRVKVKPDSSPTVFSGTTGNKLPAMIGKPFYLVLKGSRRLGIARRLAGRGPRGGKFHVFHGPSVSQVFDNVKDEVLPEASAIYTAQVNDAMRYLLSKRKVPSE